MRKLSDWLDHVKDNQTGYFFGAIFVFFLGGWAYYTIPAWIADGRRAQLEQQVERDAETALLNGNPEPVLGILRNKLDFLERRHKNIERHPTLVVKTNRRTGVETRTEDLTNQLPEIYSQIAGVKRRMAEIEPIRRKRNEEAFLQVKRKSEADAQAVLESDGIILARIESGYHRSMDAFTTTSFALKFSEEFKPHPPAADGKNDESRPSATRNQFEWSHRPPHMLFRWEQVLPRGNQGFVFTDGKSVWTYGDRREATTSPVVTTRPIDDLQAWSKQFKIMDRPGDAMREPVSFLECLGMRLYSEPTAVPPEESRPPYTSLRSLLAGTKKLVGKEDVDGIPCWHVKFKFVPVDRDYSGLVTEAWFDEAVGCLPRRMVIKHIITSEFRRGEVYSWKVKAYVSVEYNGGRLWFPKEWTKWHWAMEPGFWEEPAAKEVSAHSSEFLLLGAIETPIQGSLSSPPIPEGIPAIPEADLPEWKRKHGRSD